MELKDKQQSLCLQLFASVPLGQHLSDPLVNSCGQGHLVHALNSEESFVNIWDCSASEGGPVRQSYGQCDEKGSKTWAGLQHGNNTCKLLHAPHPGL
jgi:hypothetical protein